jgi:apolipoprotein D and lipocalin family protein
MRHYIKIVLEAIGGVISTEENMKKLLLCNALLILSGCLGIPQSISPVSDFELEKYLGKWYEIAPLDHPFERGLEQVTAEYTLQQDGSVLVKNRGFFPEKNQWREAEAKASFARDSNEGYLKVSFFGPFYSSYVVFELDKDNYQYAFVSGSNRSYLWFLSRTPTVDGALMSRFVETAQRFGFDTDNLIFVNQQQGQ